MKFQILEALCFPLLLITVYTSFLFCFTRLEFYSQYYKSGSNQFLLFRFFLDIQKVLVSISIIDPRHLSFQMELSSGKKKKEKRNNS